MAQGPGPVALVGSGEFLPGMVAVDTALLEGRPRRAVVLPTAAAREGDERVAHWITLARAHYEAMGVEPVPLDVRTRADAADPAVAGAVEGAGLVYLSGGDPHHLARTIEATPLWSAIRSAWEKGTAIGGCSAGAMALTSGAPDDLFASASPSASASPPASASPSASTPFVDGGGRETRAAGVANGLGLLAGLAVIPHFDWMQRWRAGALERFMSWQPPGTTLVGIDEDTALVGDLGRWHVAGRGAVWVFEPDDRVPYRPGDEVPVLPAPRIPPPSRNVAPANTVEGSER